MARKSQPKLAAIVPNWDGEATLKACLDSLLAQTAPLEIIVVENGSTDGSRKLLKDHYQGVTVLEQEKNLGFAGGVNVGIRYALERGYDYVALLNNDAVAAPSWAAELASCLDNNPAAGIATPTILNSDGATIDSTGECFTNWGLPYPRGRGEPYRHQYDKQLEVFGASGGASMYRASMLREIGLFDEDFFAYYEDVDLSFRAQLAGWRVRYEPQSVVRHEIGATTRKIKGFTTYQTMKNQPLVILKNVPRKYLWRVTWRHTIAHSLFFLRAISRHQGWIALKGDAVGTRLLLKNFSVRRRIQQTRKVSDDYIWSIVTHDLPPEAAALRKLRRRLRRK
jgi:GT2 family glycosyltransferase